MPETISQVLSFSNEGVHFDSFNPSAQPIPCICCKLDREWVAYSTSTQLVLQSTDTPEQYVHSISDIKSIEGLVGSTATVITREQKMYVVQKDKVLFTAERIKTAVQGRDYVAYIQEEKEAAELVRVKTPQKSQESIVTVQTSPAEEASGLENKDLQKEEATVELPNKLIESTAKAPAKTEDATGTIAPSNSAVAKKSGKPGQTIKKDPVVLNIQKKEGIKTAVVNKPKPRFLKVYSIEQQKEVKEIRISAPLLFAITNKTLVTVRVFKAARGEIELIRLENGEKVKKHRVLNMISASFVADSKYGGERLLCLCLLNSTNGTYYDTKALYYIDTAQCTLKLISGICNPITDVAFLKKDEFAVCYDNSPSKIGIFNPKGEKIKSLKEGVRNKMFFSRHENIVCLAGMNNLPGNMEIAEYPSEIVLSVNEEVGCSVIDWSPEGRFYLVGITNKMSIDNKVVLFDYYSQKISELCFKDLKDCMFAGKTVEFAPVVNPPAKIQIRKAAVYVPPSLRNGDSEKGAEWVPAHIIKDKAKSKENRIASLKKELLEIEQIEAMMSKGQVVPGGIIKIQKKEALLKKLNKKKKTTS